MRQQQSRKVNYFAFGLGLAVLVVDAISKYYTQEVIPLLDIYSPYPYGGIALFQNLFGGIEFSLVHATNRGAAWGILASYQDPLMIFRMLLIAGTFLYLCFLNKQRSWEAPFALILAGATGNVIDFFLYGHVIDMFQFIFWGYHYPVFNVADSAIFSGIAWLFLLSWQENRNKISSES